MNTALLIVQSQHMSQSVYHQMHRLFVSHKVVRWKGNKMKDLNKKEYFMVNGEKVEVSAEVGKWYRNTQDATRIRQRRRGLCNCPSSKWQSCSSDCTMCPYEIRKNISLDGLCSSDGDEYGYEFVFQYTKNNYISFEDAFAESEMAKEILKRIQEQMPELIEFGKLRLEGYTHSKISETLHIKRSTLDSRREKMLNCIRKEFSDINF